MTTDINPSMVAGTPKLTPTTVAALTAVVAVALIDVDGRVLLAKRPAKKMAGMGIPGRQTIPMKPPKLHWS